jgi:hypothetical protein
MLATGHGGREVIVWETATARPRHRLAGARPLAFSPDGSWLVVEDHDGGGLALHDLVAGRQALRAPSFVHNPTAVAFSANGRSLAVALADTTILVYDLAVLAKERPALRLTEKELGERWADLAWDDAGRAGRALGELVRCPGPTVALVKTKLSPAEKKKGAKTIKQLLTDLDDDSFEVREAASRDLAARGAEARPAMRELLGRTESVEVRRRIEDLLTDETVPRALKAGLQQARAVEVLERIGSAEARRLLEALAGGDERAPLTLDARAALRRLVRR